MFSLLFTFSFGVSAEDNSAKIAKIEKKIAKLQEQLNELRKQQIESDSGEYIAVSEYSELFTDADKYSGKSIRIAGKMYGTAEQDENIFKCSILSMETTKRF